MHSARNRLKMPFESVLREEGWFGARALREYRS
jgi:hypothetical protein